LLIRHEHDGHATRYGDETGCRLQPDDGGGRYAVVTVLHE